MEIEAKEKKEDAKPEKKAKSYGKARKGIYFGPSLGFEGTEAYKLLRTNLKFAVPAEKECKVVGVTSSLRGEGKSTTAINLAYAGHCFQATAGETQRTVQPAGRFMRGSGGGDPTCRRL